MVQPEVNYAWCLPRSTFDFPCYGIWKVLEAVDLASHSKLMTKLQAYVITDDVDWNSAASYFDSFCTILTGLATLLMENKEQLVND